MASNELAQALKHAGGGGGGTRLNRAGRQISKAGWGLSDVLHPQRMSQQKLLRGAPGLAQQASDIIESAPSGAVQFAKGVATDPLAAAATGALIGGAAASETGPGALIGAGIGGAVGLAGAGIRSLVDPNYDNPLETSQQVLESFQRTGGRLIHPSRYAKASREGNIVASIVEDVANLSAVASAGAKGLSAATGGAAEEAAAARAAAESYRAAAQQEGAQVAKLTSEAVTPGVSPALAAAKMKLAQHLAGSVDAWTLQAEHATEKAAAAEAAAGPLLKPYKVLKSASNLGAKGANLPAEVYTGGARAIGKVFKAIGAEATPRLEAALASSEVGTQIVDSLAKMRGQVEQFQANHHLRGQVSDEIHAGAMRAVAEAEPYRRLRDSWIKAVPDTIEQQAGLIVATGIPEQLARLHAEVGPDVVAHVIDFATQRNGEFFGASPEALKLAMEYTQGRIADEGLAGRLQASEQYARELVQPIEQGYVDMRGLAPWMQTEQQAGARDWQVHGQEPNPVAMDRAQAQREQVMGLAGRRLGESRQNLERASGRLQFSPEQLRAPVKATRLDVQSAMQIGGQFAQEHPDLAAQLFPDGVQGPLHMQRLIADAVLQARNAGIVDQLPKPLADMIGTAEFSGEKSLVGKLAPAEKLIRQGRREGAADAATQIAERLNRIAEQARAKGDVAGAALADARAKLPNTPLTKVVRAARKVQTALDRVNRAKARAERLAEPERAKLVGKAQRGLEKEIHAQRRVIRQALYEQSNDELAALYQDMGGWFPASHPKWLSRVSRGGAADIRHPSIDFWNRLQGEAEMPSLIGRPPQVIPSGGRGESLDILIDNYRRHVMPDAPSDEVIDAILSRLNGAARNRLMANGIITRGIENTRWAMDALAMQGFDAASAEELLPMLEAGTPKEIAGRMFDASAVSPITEQSANRVLAAVEARMQAEQEGVRGQIPNRELSSMAEGTPRPQVASPAVEGLSPFEQSLADRVFAQAKLVAAQRNEPRVGQDILRRIVDETAAKGLAAGRAQGAEAAATRGAGIAENVAGAATEAAQRNNEGAMVGGVGTMTGRAFGTGVTAGRQARDVAVALRDVGVKERTYERLDAKTQEQVQAAADSIRNAPARYKPLLRFNEAAQQGIEDYIAEHLNPEDGHDPLVAEQLRAFAADIPVTLAAAVDQGFDPRYTIGGQMPEGRRGVSSRPNNEGRLPRVVKGSETRERASTVGPRSAEEATALAVKRTTDWVRNETAYRLQARFGTAPTSVLGLTGEQVGIDTQKLRTAPDDERAAALQDLRDQAREQGLAVVQGDGGSVLFIPSEHLNGKGLADAMAEQGYVAWNPGSMFEKVPPGQVNLSTTFVPQAMLSRFARQLGEAKQLEQAFRKFYDKPMRLWKDQVLALSPRWHVNNIIGNMVTATAGGGIDPITYGRNFYRATKILKAMHDDGRLAKLQEADPEGAQIALTLDPRIHQGSEGAALGPGTELNVDSGPRLKRISPSRLVRGYKKVTQGSYEFNGFVDDASRLSIFLTERKRMTDAQLAEWVRRNPDLGYHFGEGKGGLDGIRDELAVRQSLKVAGDFTRLSPFERQVVRRVLPFYPWMRHITKLALRMPVTAPVRTAWLMHLAAIFGEPPAFPFLSAYVPVGAERPDQSRSYLHVGNVNPFNDIAYGSQGSSDFSLTDIPAGVLSQVSPAISTGVGLATGIDLRTGQQITRPAGTYNLDAYGRDSRTPLLAPSRWGEAAGYLSNLLPAHRVARAALDGLEYGGKLPLRYPTGQVMRSQGHTIMSDRQWYGPLTDLLGVPLGGPENVQLAQLRGRRDERLRRALASRRRYAGSSTSGSSTGGGRLPAWGSK